MQKCQACGAVFSSQMRFCGNCGTPVVGNTQTSTQMTPNSLQKQYDQTEQVQQQNVVPNLGIVYEHDPRWGPSSQSSNSLPSIPGTPGPATPAQGGSLTSRFGTSTGSHAAFPGAPTNPHPGFPSTPAGMGHSGYYPTPGLESHMHPAAMQQPGLTAARTVLNESQKRAAKHVAGRAAGGLAKLGSQFAAATVITKVIIVTVVAAVVIGGSGLGIHAYTQAHTPPSNFVYTDGSSLVYLYWLQGNNGQVNGKFEVNNYSSYSTGSTSSTSLAVTGTQQDNTISLEIQVLATNLAMTGTIQNNTLLVTLPSFSSSQPQKVTMYAASQADYDQLLAAFSPYMQVKLAMENADTATNGGYSGSSLTYSADQQVASVQSTVTALQNGVNTMATCNDYYSLSYSYLYSSSFDLTSYAPDTATVQSDQKTMDSKYAVASAVTLPSVQGLTIAWAYSREFMSAEDAKLTKVMSDANTQYAKDKTTMASLQTQYNTLETQVQQFATNHNC